MTPPGLRCHHSCGGRLKINFLCQPEEQRVQSTNLYSCDTNTVLKEVFASTGTGAELPVCWSCWGIEAQEHTFLIWKTFPMPKTQARYKDNSLHVANALTFSVLFSDRKTARSHLINFYCQYHFCALKYSSKITLFRNYKNISIGSGFYLYEDYDFQPNLSWQLPFSFWLIPTTCYWTGFGSLPHGTPSQWGQHGKWLGTLSFLHSCRAPAPLVTMVMSRHPCSYTLPLHSRHQESWWAFSHPSSQSLC